jgi:uncharacterized protein (TIGR02452 family)
MDNKTRIQVYQHTQQFALNNYPNVATTTKYTEKDKDMQNIRPKIGFKPIVKVFNNDTLDACAVLIKEGFKPALLNMASNTTPGGGVVWGAEPQEENIFRRTNYFMTLHTGYYPLFNADTLYSKDVVYFKSNQENGYQLINPMKISIIACPSVKHPVLNEHGEFKEEDLKLEYSKIVMIFKTAIINDHDSLLLSAFGCGCYKCPSKQVAELFKKAINEYGAYFKKIVFAIRQMSEERIDNFTIFEDVLK